MCEDPLLCRASRQEIVGGNEEEILHNTDHLPRVRSGDEMISQVAKHRFVSNSVLKTKNTSHRAVYIFSHHLRT